MKKKRQGFFGGAAILALGGIIVKIIGACYKIPLGNILGPVGMADFSIAYNIYALLFVLSTAGIPSAVSKMVSEADARRDFGMVQRIYKVSYITFAAVGFVGFSVMFFGAEKLAQLMGSQSAALSIRAISPAVMFVCVSAINRGYFQGHSNMYPTAISEILEAAGKLLFGIAVAVALKYQGFGNPVISAGAIAGVSIGAFLSALFFVFCRDDRKYVNMTCEEPDGKIIRNLLGLAVPITAGAAIMSLGNVVDSALVMNLLQSGGFSEYRAKWLFGAYNYAATLFNLPSVFTVTLAVSTIPAVSAALARCEKEKANELANTSVCVTATIAFAAAFGLAALSDEIIEILYGDSIGVLCTEASALILRYLCFAIPALGIVTATNSIHQSMGKVYIPVMSGIVGVAVKVASNFLLVGRAEINILGAAISTVLCYVTVAVFNTVALHKNGLIKLRITKVLIKPMVPGIAAYITSGYFARLTRSAFGLSFSTIFSVFVGFLACIGTAFLTGIVSVKGGSVCWCGKNISKFLNND